jgi:protein MAK11
LNSVKAIDLLAISLPSKTITTYASTVSSDGKINVYDLASLPPISSGKLSPKQIEPITSYDTKGTRLTCLAMADGEMTKTPTSVGVKRRLDEEGDAKISDDGETGSEEEEGDQEKDDEEEELEEEEG